MTNASTHVRRFRRSLAAASLAASLAALLLHGGATGQESHYWNLSYGTRSSLLSGAVIGSVSDLSATYYNPGALGLNQRGEVLLSGSVYELQVLTVADAQGSQSKLASVGLSPAPSFIAGRLAGDSTDENRVAYSVLTRFWGAIDMKARAALYDPDRFANATGGWLSTEILMERDVSDVWLGITWSRPLTQQLGIGLTTYGAYRTQSLRRAYTRSILPDSGAQGSANLITDYSFKSARLLFKTGLMYELPGWSFGLTVTTPGVELFGGGEGYLNFSALEIDLDGDSTADNYYLAQAAKDMDAAVKSPWSVGFGVSTELGPFIIDASAEWYGTVDDYNIMEAPPSPNQTTGDTMQIALRTGNKSVVNYGAGIEYKLGEQTSFYGSFIIDKSSAPDSSAGTMTLATFDYVQLSAGAIFTLGRASITSGVAYITGSGPIRSNLEELVQSQLPGIGDELEVSARRVRVTVAFSYLIE